MSEQPIYEFQEGNVHVAIWKNEGPKGAFRSATVQLRYIDRAGDWQTGTSYGQRDLESLEKAAHEARERLKAIAPDAASQPEAAAIPKTTQDEGSSATAPFGVNVRSEVFRI
jgi:hypothetical protein